MTTSDTRHKTFVYIIIFCAGIGGMLYGYDIGVISGALLFINKTIPLTDTEIGLIVGAVLGGGVIANLVTGYLADRFGRKKMILAASFVFLLGISLILKSHSFLSLFTARLLLGLGVGIVSVAIPLYISEVAPTSIRGLGVTVFQVFLTFSILLAYFVDLLLAQQGNWHGMFMVLYIPSLALLCTMLLLPESPRWLVSQQRVSEAREVLELTHHDDHIEQDLQAIRESMREESSVAWRELFSPQLTLPLTIALFVAAFNQLTGINSILQYAPLVFKSVGMSGNHQLMQATVLIGLVNFLTSVLALLLIDRVGRKPLILLGTAGLVITDFMLGAVSHSHLSLTLQAQLQVYGLLLWIFFFAIGPGVVVWLVFSELFPTRIRGRGMALCLFVNSLCSAVLSSIFLPIIDHIGMGNTFYLLGFFSLLYCLVSAWLLPETKGQSLEQIQAYFHRHLPKLESDERTPSHASLP